MKKDILFLCQFFYPEHNSSATLPFDTAKFLASCGYRVGALCGYPKEYTDEKHIPLNEVRDGVEIHRIKYLQTGRAGTLGRLINYFSFTLHVLLRLPVFRKYRSVVVYSNPPILPLVAVLANKLFRTKIIFVAYDVYPEVAYASSSVTAGSAVDRVMKWINKKMYRRASRVIALTEEMKRFILSHRDGITAERMAVIPNWAHEGTVASTASDGARFGITSGKTVVSYFGNMGICQDMETLTQAVNLLREREDIHFLFAGHGNKLAAVKRAISDHPNVTLCEFLVDDAFERALSVSDCGIVSLERGLIGTCAPSKYYSYLNASCAVIAVAEEESYLAAEVVQKRIGAFVKNGDAAALRDAIVQFADNKALLFEAQERAKALYDASYAREHSMQKYFKEVKEVLTD